MIKISEKVFDNMVNELAEKAYDSYIDNDYDRPEEVSNAEDELDIFVGKLNLEKEVKNDLDILILGAGAAYERYGFLAGYKAALKLAKTKERLLL